MFSAFDILSFVRLVLSRVLQLRVCISARCSLNLITVIFIKMERKYLQYILKLIFLNEGYHYYFTGIAHVAIGNRGV